MALRRKKHNSINRFKRAVEHNDLFPYLARYLQTSETQGISAETLRRRDSALRRFIEWCDERSIDDPRTITKPILERYQRSVYYYRKDNGEPLSVGSQVVILTPIKSFFKWLTQENYLLYNPASELVLPKKPKALPRHILTIEEVFSILAQPDLSTPEGIRNRAILETLYATGIRRSELVGLMEYDIDHSRKTVLVREGKNNKDRYLPLGERALHWISRYQEEVRPLLLIDHQEQRLFLTDYGEPFNGSYIGGLVKRIIQQAGIDKPGSCHLFRHAMATHITDLSTTEVYTRVSIEKLSDIHRATHPAEHDATD